MIIYHEESILKIISDNKQRFGYITQNTILLGWHSIQSIVRTGIRYYYKMIKSDILTEKDIENEIYITYSKCMLKYNPTKDSSFRYYLQRSINRCIERIAGEVIKQTKCKCMPNVRSEMESHNFILHDIKNHGFSESEIKIVELILIGTHEKILTKSFSSKQVNITKKKLKEVYYGIDRN